MIKQYSFSGINYGYSKAVKKWVFNLPKLELLVQCNGQERAHKVAHIVAGSVKRCGGLDNLARTNLRQVGAI